MGEEGLMPQEIGYRRADKEVLVKAYVGRTISEVPTPACVLNRQVVAGNCRSMLMNADDQGVSFRAHIKTHKTLEGVRLQLGTFKHGKIVVSTVMEAYSVLPLVDEGLLWDVLYGFPVVQSRIPELAKLASRIPNLRLMVDSEAQLHALVNYARQMKLSIKWSIFIKVDCSTHRAGLLPTSESLKALINLACSGKMTEHVEIYGFYVHAGHSYADKTREDAEETLRTEIHAADSAAAYAESVMVRPTSQPFTLSVGATPTAHASCNLKKEDFRAPHGKVELHAGCYPFCDLQQLATSLICEADIAIRVVAEVASSYVERDEMLINAGCIALGREFSTFPGFGHVTSPTKNEWQVGRMSQEHGILTRVNQSHTPLLPEGEKVLIIPQHACITGAGYQWYYIVDEEGPSAKVVDIWIRFNGW